MPHDAPLPHDARRADSRRESAPGRSLRATATLMVAALVAGLSVLVGLTPAHAAAGDYTVTMSAPTTIPVYAPFSYQVTIDRDTAGGGPTSGIVLTAQLPAGLLPGTVPTGPDSPVESYEYDPGTRILTLTLRPLVQELSDVVFPVTQVDNTVKDSTTVYTTTITGTATPSGPIPSASATTAVTGDLDYVPLQSYSTVVGGNNRAVTYVFDMRTLDPTGSGTTFTSWGQRFTNSFPAGAVVTASSSGLDGTGTDALGGTWTITGTPATGQSAVWERSGAGAQYGPAPGDMDDGGQNVWITVTYPEADFPDGTRPPANTVDLDVRDFSGTWENRPEATVQGPEFSGGSIKQINIKKNANPDGELESYDWPNGGWIASYGVAASYLNDQDDDLLDSLTVEDSAALDADNASFFDSIDVFRISVTFNPALKAANLPYTFEYTTSAGPSWITYANRTTGTDLTINTQVDGSTGWDQAPFLETAVLPLGSHVTGWRVVLSPGAADPAIESGAEVKITPQFNAIYRGTPGGTNSHTNTAVASGALATGAPLPSVADLSHPNIVDRVPLVALLDAPPSLTVGAPATYSATFSNLDPTRSYANAVMRLVLPVGVFYDQTAGVTPAWDTTPASGKTVPTPGNGLTITTSTVTDADGEHQVVEFTFDDLESIRVVGEPKTRWEGFAMRYEVPVTVVAQAYTPGTTSVATRNFGTVDSAPYDAVEMGHWWSYYGPDIFDFNPNLTDVAVSTTQTPVATAGGLLIGKLVRASDADGWSTLAQVQTPGTAQWQVYVANVLTEDVTDLVLFDRLPVVGDGRDSAFAVTLTETVSGAPAGATVEYSTDATTATSGTWTADPVGATAFRVTVPALPTGSSFTLELDATDIPEGLLYQAQATNDVTATAVYQGTPRDFESNVASVVAQAVPSMEIVKKTNGIVYDASPGALVATASTVLWTYEVTNTGNAPLNDFVLSDAFTDGSGATGTLTPEGDSLTPLLPGQTRTFSASGTAVTGQYQNTVTADAVVVEADGTPAVNAPEVPQVTDDSWYLAGQSGVSIVKTTNGQVVPSAPGLLLEPGSDVVWTYTVTNDGDSVLTDLLVEDRDTATGELVFSGTITSLAPGASATLTAGGIAVTGQYHNRVTVAATDPVTGGPLTGADDSFYFGAEPGFAVSKLVSTSATGPWTDSVTVAPGATVYWQVTVTNTGNLALTDLTAHDAALDETYVIALLPVGATDTRVFAQTDVTAGYTNTVAVSVVDPVEPTVPVDPPPTIDEEDGATVVVDPDLPVDPTIPPTAAPTPGTGTAGGIAATGATAGLLGLAVLALLAVGGVLLVVRRHGDQHD